MSRIFSSIVAVSLALIMWDVTGQKNYDLDLRSLNRGAHTGLKNDWNIFINVTTYF